MKKDLKFQKSYEILCLLTSSITSLKTHTIKVKNFERYRVFSYLEHTIRMAFNKTIVHHIMLYAVTYLNENKIVGR